jgi:hypothetical protein
MNLCKSSLSDCKADETKTNPADFGYTELNGGNRVGTAGLEFNLTHSGSECSNAANCHYLFVLQNTNGASKTISMMVQAKLTDPGDIYLNRKYVKELLSGRYFYYEIG